VGALGVGSLTPVLDRLRHLEEELAHVESQLGDPTVTGDRERFAEIGRRHSQLTEIVRVGQRWEAAVDDVSTARELLAEAIGDEADELRELEAAGAETAAELLEEFRLLLLPPDPNAGRNVIVEIRGAEGGEEANLWARDLFEMYKAYAASKGWSLEVLGAHRSDMGGFTDVAFTTKGDAVWTHLKHEGGPHRVQRVPVTESQGRVHTSSATVTVLPEADEVEVDIDNNDLEIDTYRASGPGGQSVNTTDSAVRVTHKPTGLVVSMQDEKSQLQNKAKALRVLRARLLKLHQDEQASSQAALKRDQVKSGGRSEKIRTYNFKESRVTDHRIGLTIYKLDRVLAGDLDEVVEPLMLAERQQQLEAAAGAD
jgi:peptide chain release factor 1